jgi:uncharacterized protein
MPRSRRSVLFFVCFAAVPFLLSPAAVWGQKGDPLDKRFTRTVAMIAMRDGVKLHTTVFVAKEVKGPLPFILYRTPYGADARSPWKGSRYARPPR